MNRKLKIINCILLVLLFLGVQNQALAYNEVMKPNVALKRLMEGNKRFVKDATFCPDRSQDRRLATEAQQKPFAIVLGCADSRVPPELAFDQGIGDIFVVRVAGNIVAPCELDSIEYSAIYNGSAIIVVLGHENCGAVDAVLKHNTKDIEFIADLIEPAVANHKHSLDEAIEANIRNSVAQIKASKPIAKLMKEGKLDVVGAYYNLKTGKVRLLD